MDAKNRLLEFLKYLNIGQNRFEAHVGISNGYINNNKGSIGTKVLDKISAAYPELNTHWLITGEGEMLKTNIETYPVPTACIRYRRNLDASAGNKMMFNDENEKDYQMMHIPGFEDCTDALNVWGDSMYPVLKSGEIVILKEWRESFFNYGKIYLIITKKGNRMIKYINPSSEPGKIKCVSENKEHAPFDVELEDIYKIFIVKGHIEKCAI